MYSDVDEDQESGTEGNQSTEIQPPTDSQNHVLGTDNNEQSVNREISRGTNKQCFIVLDPVEFFSIIITAGRNDEYVRGDVYIFVSDEMVNEEMWKKIDIDNATSLVRLSHVVRELDSSAVLLRNGHLLISSPTYEGILKMVRNEEDLGIEQDLEMIFEPENELDFNLEDDKSQKETDNCNKRSRRKRKTPSWMMDMMEI